MRFQLSILVLSFAGIALSATTTTYYIDKIPAYAALPTCALDPVRIIVRTMSLGCGDGGQYTSYDCFCSSAGSSSKFDSLISSSVAKQCTADTAGVASASAVFHSYCLLGSAVTTAGNPMNTSVPTSAQAGSSSVIAALTSKSSRASNTATSSTATPTSASSKLSPKAALITAVIVILSCLQ